MISLGFVFAAITELAVLLFIKQQKGTKYRAISTESCYELNENSNSQHGGAERETDNVQEVLKLKMASQRNQDTEVIHRSQISNRFYALHIYTRIDLCVLIFFNFSYALFNVIYWICLFR